MARFAVPCSHCGEPVKATLCPDCQKSASRQAVRSSTPRPKKSAYARGYNSAWRRLSERARKLQPFCSDCGATDDLQADHSPEAWDRVEQGLPLRLKDIDVVCQRCNIDRGAARGEHSVISGRRVADEHGGTRDR